MQQTEARYKAILNAIPDFMFRLNRDGIYLDFKGEGANATIPKEEIVGKHVSDFLPPDVVAKSAHAIAQTLATKKLHTIEYQLPTSIGLRDYEARLVVCGDDEVLVIVRDITESKQAEVALHQSEEKFKKAFGCSPNAISISTLEKGQFLEVNDSFVRLSGFAREEIIGKTAFDINIWALESDRSILIQELRTKGFARNLEFVFRRKSGELGVALVSAEIIELNGQRCIVSVNHDITERKQAEELLLLTSQKNRLLAETLGRIRRSLKLEDILQTTVTEVRQFLQTDRVFIALNHPLKGARILAESVESGYPSVFDSEIEDPKVIEEMKRLLTTEKIRIIEDTQQADVCVQLKAHYQKYQTQATLAVPIILGHELFGALIANQCRSVRQWQGMDIDLLQQVSEHVAIAIQQAQLYQKLEELNINLERQVQQRTAELQQKVQELKSLQNLKDVILHTVSHELRTSVMGTLMVLKNIFKKVENKDKKGLKESITSSFVSISDSVITKMIQGNERQLGMINSLLELHCQDSRELLQHKEFMSCSNLLNNITDELQPTLQANQATLSRLIPENLPLVSADFNQMRRVVESLFAYCCQRNPPGLHFNLTAKLENDMILTVIEDNGVAVTTQESDRLFNLFIAPPQACLSTSESLKLYLCRQIIQAHGGDIGVRPNTVRGSIFWFSLPTSRN